MGEVIVMLDQDDKDELEKKIEGIKVPTKTSQLENDSAFITKTVNDLAYYYLKSETYSKAEVDNKLSVIPKFEIKVVSNLPTTDISTTTVYLLKSGDEAQNLYTEYIYVNNAWEYLGKQTVDLSGYALKTDMPTKLSDLFNDSGFLTNTVTNLVNYYTKTESDNKYQPKGNYLTQHQDISGKADKATTLAGYGITDGATKTELSALQKEIDDQLPPHKNIPRKPQTVIVNNCQDSTTYKGSGLTVNTTDHIIGSQCVNVSGQTAYVRFTKNVFDIKNNHLVVKIRVNSLDDNVVLYVKAKHTTSETDYVTYFLDKKNSNSLFGEWREYTIPYLSYSDYHGDVSTLDFTAINDVFVGVKDNSGGTGSGDIDVQFVGLRSNNQSKGIISFTFDDGWKSQYDGIKILAERGLTGTIYHIEELSDTETLTTAELKELVKYYNADIEVHGANFYNSMTSDEIVEVWKSNQNYLKKNGLSDGRHLAYPGGQYPSQASDIVMKYFDSARTIDGCIQQETFPPHDNYKMRAFTGVSDDKVSLVKQQIDRTVENKSWLILVFHKIEDGHSGDGMYCTPSALAEIADYAIASGARIMNVAEVFETNGGGSGGANIDDIINALPVYNGEVV